MELPDALLVSEAVKLLAVQPETVRLIRLKPLRQFHAHARAREIIAKDSSSPGGASHSAVG